MRVIVSCPSRSCSRMNSFNGMARCQSCGAYLIAKPSSRRKQMDLRSKGIVWLWKPDIKGAERITVQRAELDPEGMERTVVTTEAGRWVQLANGIIRLHPDMRRVGIPDLPFLRNVRIVEGVCGPCLAPCEHRSPERRVCVEEMP